MCIVSLQESQPAADACDAEGPAQWKQDIPDLDRRRHLCGQTGRRIQLCKGRGYLLENLCANSSCMRSPHRRQLGQVPGEGGGLCQVHHHAAQLQPAGAAADEVDAPRPPSPRLQLAHAACRERETPRQLSIALSWLGCKMLARIIVRPDMGTIASTLCRKHGQNSRHENSVAVCAPCKHTPV